MQVVQQKHPFMIHLQDIISIILITIIMTVKHLKMLELLMIMDTLQKRVLLKPKLIMMLVMEMMIRIITVIQEAVHMIAELVMQVQ